MTSSLDHVIAAYRELKALAHEIGRVPQVSPERLEQAGNLSGVALRILYAPLLDLTRQKQATYGEAAAELARRLLAVSGRRTYDPTLEVTVGWRDAIPADPLGEWEVAARKEAAGVSRYTILEEAGYNPELEAERRTGDAQASLDQVQTAFARGGFAR